MHPIIKGAESRRLIDCAMAELEAKTIGLDALIHFADCVWQLDQDEGIISFSRNTGLVARAPVQIIGTYNSVDCTWVWAWDNVSIDDALKIDAGAVREYAFEHNMTELTSRKVKCSESDCWEFTALACKLCDAQGAYRAPAGNTFVFLTFGKVRLANNG